MFPFEYYNYYLAVEIVTRRTIQNRWTAEWLIDGIDH
jgi:hypothetical protein